MKRIALQMGAPLAIAVLLTLSVGCASGRTTRDGSTSPMPGGGVSQTIPGTAVDVDDTGNRGSTVGHYYPTGAIGGRRYGLTLSYVRTAFDRDDDGGTFGGTTATGALTTNYANTSGYGASLSASLGRHFALDLGGSYIRPRASFTPAGGGFGAIDGGRMRMIPLTGLLQLHLYPQGLIDPYLGAGASYVLLRNAGDLDPNAAGLQRINYDSRFGPAYQGGLLISTGSVGLNLDAKYLTLDQRPTGEFSTVGGGPFLGTQGTSKISPWVFSAGLTFGF